jgi:type I restriction enzyme, S subunit
MVCIGATIGKCGYCERDITTNQQINALSPVDGVSHKFIYYQMLTEDFQRRVLLSSGQATLPIINKSKWSALTVALPPKLEEQKRIAAKFEALCEETQRLASVYERKLTALDALKKSLLHQAFSGEL